MTWIGELCRWMADWFPRWVQIDRNEVAIKHKGWRKRWVVTLTPGVRWYWPAFSQIEGPFKTVPTTLSTSLVRVNNMVAQGFIKWKISGIVKFAVDNEDTLGMLDDLICAAIREVIEEANEYTWEAIDEKLSDAVRDATKDLGVKVLAVRLTTLTTARMHCFLEGSAPFTTAIEEE